MDISASTEASFLAAQFKAMRSAFRAEPYPSYDVRLERLKRLEAALGRHADALVVAMSEDFGFAALLKVKISISSSHLARLDQSSASSSAGPMIAKYRCPNI
jgi:hypothetical protein